MAAIASQETEVTDDSQSSLLNVYASVADYAIRHTVPAIRLAGLTLITPVVAIMKSIGKPVADNMYSILLSLAALKNAHRGMATVVHSNDNEEEAHDDDDDDNADNSVNESDDPETVQMTLLATRAQVAIMCSILLKGEQISAASSTNATVSAQRLAQLLTKLVRVKGHHPAVTETTLISIAGCMQADAQLRQIFISELLSSPSLLNSMMNRQHDLNMHDCLAVHPIAEVWDSLIIVQAAIEYIMQHQLQNLNGPIVSILHKAICHSPNTQVSITKKADQWWKYLETLMHHLTIELVDPVLCRPVADILSTLVLHPSISQKSLILVISNNNEHPLLYGALGYIFPSGAALCQETIVQLLQSIAKCSSAVKGHVVKLVNTFLNDAASEIGKDSMLHALSRSLASSS
jgi:hypothetical protein